MNYPVIEKLACPYHPDAQITVDVESETEHGASSGLICGSYCHRHRKAARLVSRDEHDRCGRLEVMEGLITCGECGRRYDITGGIASMMPDGIAGRDEKRSRADEAKAHEMEVRNTLAQKQVGGAYSELQGRIELRALMRAVGPGAGATLIDIGCGSGRLTRLYHQGFRNVIGFDFAMETLKVNRAWAVRNGARNIDLIQADAGNLPLRRGSVDAALCNDVFQHVPDEARQPFLKSIFRSLAPGGRFLITVRSFSISRKLIQLLREGRIHRDAQMSGSALPIHFYTREEISGLLARCGFDVRKVYGLYCGIPRHPGKIWESLMFVENAIQRTPLSLAIGNLYAAEARKRV